jgi:hypothetical protein
MMVWLTDCSREKADWLPTIDNGKYVSCGICMNCGKHIYEWKYRNREYSKIE